MTLIGDDKHTYSFSMHGVCLPSPLPPSPPAPYFSLPCAKVLESILLSPIGSFFTSSYCRTALTLAEPAVARDVPLAISLSLILRLSTLSSFCFSSQSPLALGILSLCLFIFVLHLSCLFLPLILSLSATFFIANFLFFPSFSFSHIHVSVFSQGCMLILWDGAWSMSRA